jgi:hypothetical protein
MDGAGAEGAAGLGVVGAGGADVDGDGVAVCVGSSLAQLPSNKLKTATSAKRIKTIFFIFPPLNYWILDIF